jgi:hypothetical protein
MPRYNFGDEENRSFEVMPKGDYILEVIGAESGIKDKGKTKGADFLTVKLRVENHPGCTFEEDLIFFETTFWRVDTFLKAMNFQVNGRPMKKGDPVELTTENVIGLRGPATLGIREWDKKNERGDVVGKGQINEVITWITNGVKLPRNVPAPAPVQNVPVIDEEGPLF